MGENKPKDKATLKIPRQLYNNLKTLIEGTGFDSVTDFVVYVLRDVASYHIAPDQHVLSKDEVDMIRQRLRNLGYM